MSASEMTYIVSSGALNSTHSLTSNNGGNDNDVDDVTAPDVGLFGFLIFACWFNTACLARLHNFVMTSL